VRCDPAVNDETNMIRRIGIRERPVLIARAGSSRKTMNGGCRYPVPDLDKELLS
jgi:hypothetical protein